MAKQSQSFDANGNVIATIPQAKSAIITGDDYANTVSPVLVSGGFFAGGPSGVALVRPRATKVSEPSIFALFSLAIGGFMLLRCKQCKYQF